jgi:hypothetical protein
MDSERIRDLNQWISEDPNYQGDLLEMNGKLLEGSITALEYSILVEQLYRRADSAEIDERRRAPASDDCARKEKGAA